MVCVWGVPRRPPDCKDGHLSQVVPEMGLEGQVEATWAMKRERTFQTEHKWPWCTGRVGRTPAVNHQDSACDVWDVWAWDVGLEETKAASLECQVRSLGFIPKTIRKYEEFWSGKWHAQMCILERSVQCGGGLGEEVLCRRDSKDGITQRLNVRKHPFIFTAQRVGTVDVPSNKSVLLNPLGQYLCCRKSREIIVVAVSFPFLILCIDR